MKPADRDKVDLLDRHLVSLPGPFIHAARAHPLLRGLFVTAAGYFPEAHHVERPEGIPEIILIACIANRGWVRIGGGKKLPVRMGDVAFIPANIAHAYGADADCGYWSIFWSHFQGVELPHFADLLGVDGAHPILKLRPGALDEMHFPELYRVLEVGCTMSSLLASSARLRSILIDMARHRVQGNVRIGPTHEALLRNIEWMRANRHRRLTLEDLAAQAGLSVPHYCACFKRHTGSSPINYFQRLKVQHSTQLLALTDMHVDEIALAVGLDDPFYFSRLFKKVMGESPRHFRAHHKS